MFTLKVISAWSRQCLFRCGLARTVLRWYVLIWGCRHYGHYYFVSLILSHLVLSLISKRYCSGYFSSSDLEQKSFPKEEGIHTECLLCSRPCLLGPQRMAITCPALQRKKLRLEIKGLVAGRAGTWMWTSRLQSSLQQNVVLFSKTVEHLVVFP